MIRRIYNFDKLYLTRIYLWRSKKFTLYLHIFHQPDPGRDLHNHPWDWCWSMCLWGGYFERMFSCAPLTHLVERFAMTVRKFDGSTFHTVAMLKRKRCVTLFAHGARVRTWGFCRRGEFVPWHQYLVDEGINTQEEIQAIRKRFQNE